MADEQGSATSPKATLGLTGLTSNAMALIAPGAFLWLTFSEQSAYGSPSAGSAMWLGMLFATLLCLATAVSYAELSKLYPGAGSSYFFAEQAFLSKKQAFKWARLYKFAVGWASHLYYWIYPGVMVTVTCIFVGYMAGQFWPNTFSVTIGSPLLMILFAVVFAYGVSYIAFRGVVGATSVNVAINIIQITALIIFSCMCIIHRLHVQEGMAAYNLGSDGKATMYVQDTNAATQPDPTSATKPAIPAPSTPKTLPDGVTPTWAYFLTDAKGDTIQPNQDGTTILVDKNNNITVDPNTNDNPTQINTNSDGSPMTGWTRSTDGLTLELTAPATMPTTLPAGTIARAQLNTISYQGGMMLAPPASLLGANGAPVQSDYIMTFLYHNSAKSVIHWHSLSYVYIQACIAILCLVGFESVTSMGEEAKDPKKHIPIAVVASLLIQGGFCYLFEYFAANYFQSSAYTNTTAAGSPAPIGDMMQIVGAWAFGSPSAGWAFMVIEAVTVFMAMIGTTLSCINTGARVTYAMGRDEEIPAHFGILHGKNATPHRCIWTLATLSVFVGIYGILFYQCGAGSNPTNDAVLTAAQSASIWYKGVFKYAVAQHLPDSLLVITLISNFGTFALYMMSCIVAMVAFHEHHMHNFLKHKFIPLFGLVANLACMIFYLAGPFAVPGMSKAEPFWALGICAVWGVYGLYYFLGRSKTLGREVILTKPSITSSAPA